MKSLLRPLVRLPTVVFPGQPISFTKIAEKAVERSSSASIADFSLSETMLRTASQAHDGRVAAFGPNTRVGTELHLLYDDVLDSLEPTCASRSFPSPRVLCALSLPTCPIAAAR